MVVVMAIDYSQLTKEQLNVIEDYLKNDMRKLKPICYLIWGKKGLPSCYHDDLYDDAMKVLVESVISYDSKYSKFEIFLRNNLKRSYKDWYRDTHLRAKRNNLLLDSEGKIARDDRGNPIIINNISVDCTVEDGVNLCEKVSSNFKVEEEINEFSYTYLDELLEDCSKEMREYSNEILSNLQRKILELIINDYSKEIIIETLHIDSALYLDSIAAITSNKNTRNLRKAMGGKRNVR